MGWGSGSSLFSEIINNVQPHIADFEVRKKIYRPLIADPKELRRQRAQVEKQGGEQLAIADIGREAVMAQ